MLYTVHKNITSSVAIESAMNDLKQIIAHRMQTYFDKNVFSFDKWIKERFNGNLIKQEIVTHLPKIPNADEWIVLMTALVPHVHPDFFTSLISEQLPAGGDFPEFGGVKAHNHRGMLPTGETIQFILSGNDIEQRLRVQELFNEDHFFYQQAILWIEPVKEGEPLMSGRIIMAQD